MKTYTVDRWDRTFPGIQVYPWPSPRIFLGEKRGGYEEKVWIPLGHRDKGFLVQQILIPLGESKYFIREGVLDVDIIPLKKNGNILPERYLAVCSQNLNAEDKEDKRVLVFWRAPLQSLKEKISFYSDQSRIIAEISFYPLKRGLKEKFKRGEVLAIMRPGEKIFAACEKENKSLVLKYDGCDFLVRDGEREKDEEFYTEMENAIVAGQSLA